MTVKDIVVKLGWVVVIYKTGKFVGKIECLDELPNNEVTFKLGKHAKVTIKKPNKNKNQE